MKTIEGTELSAMDCQNSMVPVKTEQDLLSTIAEIEVKIEDDEPSNRIHEDGIEWMEVEGAETSATDKEESYDPVKNKDEDDPCVGYICDSEDWVKSKLCGIHLLRDGDEPSVLAPQDISNKVKFGEEEETLITEPQDPTTRLVHEVQDDPFVQNTHEPAEEGISEDSTVGQTSSEISSLGASCDHDCTATCFTMNSVDQLLSKPFTGLTHEEKLEIKRLGADQPEIKLEQTTKDRGKEYTRKFTVAWYDKSPWLTASTSKNVLFCFPCLLFGGDVSWTKAGFNDLKHLSEKVKKHEESRSHLNSSLKLALFGHANIAKQSDKRVSLKIAKHNHKVDQNRHILNQFIACIKFCGAFELPLRGHDESDESLNPEIFRGLVNFAASFDSALKMHLDTATVFKGTFKTIQNELLDCMLYVTRQFIIKQLRSTAYVAIIADGTTDVCTRTRSTLIFRYVDDNDKVVERFYCFNVLSNSSADTISAAILKELKLVFPDSHDRQKVIAQSYDGASVIRGASGGAQRKVKDLYPNAHYVHCYAHQLNLIMQQAASKISHVRIFFCDLSGFPAFFSCSPKRMQFLENIVKPRLPRMSGTRWNFHIRTVNVIYEHREDLLKCFRAIESSEEFEANAVKEARGFTRTLEDREFLFFLFLFNDIMFHVEILYDQLQKQDIDTVSIQKATATFVDSINMVSQSIDDLDSKLPIMSKFANSKITAQTLNQVARKVCDIIVVHARERFAFTKHLVSATLLQSSLFESHAKSFPIDALNDAVKAYPMLNKQRLQNELSELYTTPQLHCDNGAIALYRFFVENGLQNTFSETMSLLRIIITTPMTTSEAERSFSTLKRIKTFLSNTMFQDRIDALAMLSVEKELIKSIPKFDEQVMERFASLEDRQANFLYK